MSKVRKSSVDGTRRLIKAHIPYRADDFTHGKKTGVNVREVDRRSDGFENFDDVLTQADAFTPPHRRGKRRNDHSLTPPDEDEEDDEDGEMDMEIDDTVILSAGAQSPGAYFTNAPRPSIPTSANRSAANGGSRSSYVDFDRIPSPRPSSSSQRTRSQPNGSGAITPTPRPKSNLSQQAVVPSSDESDNEPFSDNDAIGEDDLEYDFGGGGMDFDNDPPAPQSSSPVAARTSFTEMAQDDTDPPQVDDIQISSPPRRVDKQKGKERESVVEDDMALEEEIAQGLAEVEHEDVEEAETSNIKGSKSKGRKKRMRGEAQQQQHRETRPTEKRKRLEDTNLEGLKTLDGIRRSTRTRFKPLEWWRLERFVYGRRDSGKSVVPVIKEVIRIPKERPQQIGGKRYRSKPRSRSKTVQDHEEEEEVVVFNPEEGWDDQTDPYGVVLDYGTSTEVQRRLAFTARMLTPKAAADNAFLYQKVFGDGEFIASGQLIIPVGGRKPSKGTKDNTYVFYIIEGAVNLKVHRTSFVLATGAMFMVPRGNNYYMENVSQRPAKLFFAQARRVSVDDEPLPEIVHAPPPVDGRTMSVDPAGSRHPSGKGSSLQRSSSVAATASADRLNPGDKRSAKRAVSK